MSSLVSGQKFVGKLDMFGNKFEYELILTDIKLDNSFEFTHTVSCPGICSDVKFGTGKIDDEDQIELSYEDTETYFEGVFNPNTKIFKGQTKQLNGVFANHKGIFFTKLLTN